jgi:NAD(P)-dependent dehydrogenase (short-subunit alcohol dehydrogenase family)
MRTILIFGAKGSIGNYIYNKLKIDNNVIGTTRDKTNADMLYVDFNNMDNLLTIENIDAIVWASGDNCSDNIENLNMELFDDIFEANVKFILKTLNCLLTHNKINKDAKMVIVSSIWEKLTRANKLSYTISKSALSGLVKNIAYDLSKDNILINNVLPGVIDNEMTRKALSQEQINYVSSYMYFNRLIKLEDVYNAVKYLIIENTGITGQSINVDLGFTNIKKI